MAQHWAATESDYSLCQSPALKDVLGKATPLIQPFCQLQGLGFRVWGLVPQ